MVAVAVVYGFQWVSGENLFLVLSKNSLSCVRLAVSNSIFIRSNPQINYFKMKYYWPASILGVTMTSFVSFSFLIFCFHSSPMKMPIKIRKMNGGRLILNANQRSIHSSNFKFKIPLGTYSRLKLTRNGQNIYVKLQLIVFVRMHLSLRLNKLLTLVCLWFACLLPWEWIKRRGYFVSCRLLPC